MGWVSNDNEHEGWAAAVAPDGRLSASSSGEGMLVQGITGRYQPDKMLPDYEVVPDRRDHRLARSLRLRLARRAVGARHVAGGRGRQPPAGLRSAGRIRQPFRQGRRRHPR